MSGSSPTVLTQFAMLENYVSGFFSSEKSISIEENILTLKNKEAPNKTDIRIDYIDVATNGNDNVILKIYKNPIVSGEKSVLSCPNSTIAEYEINGTEVSGGELLFITSLSKNESKRLNINDKVITLSPEEHLTISASSKSSSDLLITMGWTEKFEEKSS